MKKIDLKTANGWLDAITKVIIIIGVPVSICQYVSTSHKEKADRDYGTYNSLDHEFREWELLCLQHPELDIFDVPDSLPVILSKEQLKKETILFTILFSTFERAYLLYRNSDEDLRKAQWSGWDEYIRMYCKRKNFQQAWKVSGTTYDANFQKFMSNCITEHH